MNGLKNIVLAVMKFEKKCFLTKNGLHNSNNSKFFQYFLKHNLF